MKSSSEDKINDFDLIAPFYDFLSSIVFGKSTLKAQLLHLSVVKKTDDVLILGGGSGNLLKHLPFCENVDYVEKSVKMINKAKKRRVNKPINFIHQDFLALKTEKKYDVVICPFFLDCFNVYNLELAVDKCYDLMREEGRLIVTDFQFKKSSSLLFGIMHIFFRITSHLESKSLKDIHKAVSKNNFELIEEKFLHRKLLFSRLYRNL